MDSEEEFDAIVNAETDSFQRNFLDGLLDKNTRYLAPVAERAAEPAIARLWRR